MIPEPMAYISEAESSRAMGRKSITDYADSCMRPESAEKTRKLRNCG